MKLNFENLHQNHKLAFLDGLGSGIILTVMVVGFYRAYREDKDMRDRIAAFDEDKRQTNTSN